MLYEKTAVPVSPQLGLVACRAEFNIYIIYCIFHFVANSFTNWFRWNWLNKLLEVEEKHLAIISQVFDMRKR